MYNPTSFTYWEGCLQQHIISFRVHNRSIVKPLLFIAFDMCFKNFQNNLYFSLKSVPTNLLNMLVNRAPRYGIDFSHLLPAVAGCNLTRLDVTNFGVGRSLPPSFFEDLSRCHKLVHLDLYGFEFNLSELNKLKALNCLEIIYLGCHQKHNIFSENLIDILTQFRLTSLNLRHFTIDLTSLNYFPRLISLDMSSCEISRSNTPHLSLPPLKSLSISKPLNNFLSSNCLEIAVYATTLETLRISFISFELLDLFKYHIFPQLSELEIIYCKYWECYWFENLTCPNLSKVIYLSPSDTELGFPTIFPFELITHSSSPPILMELILNHFHNPEVAEILANIQSSTNTFFWEKGRMGSRAKVSPHFLIIAYVLFLNPKRLFETGVLVDRLGIGKYTCDLEIICGEDYIIPLVHYVNNSESPYYKNIALKYVQIAKDNGYIINQRLLSIVSQIC
ncbi:hypothetical protein LOD99_7361 [Oopsacas minuta]|uniref:Uncharacterized protein n=1 Tax=Oopsacas minuta TaxID=111878 RepID=A0AAV7JU80_9METZ|nr:hypothetical protein LOD99_7361 [Oopsacas minuta]